MGMMSVGLTMAAQNGDVPGAYQTRPANDPSGKILTMEETILSKELAPEDLMCRWADAGHVAMFKDGKWVSMDIATGDTAKFVPQAKNPYVYSKNGNLYLRKDSEDVAIVVSEDKNISYGTTVSRNEFGISGGVFISPDSSKVAFYRKDESKVSSFPLLDITTRTGSLKEIKYPMAGMDSELLALGIYDIAKGSIVYVQVDDFDQERYLTNVTWSPDNSKVFVQVVDRAQKNMRLNVYDAADGSFIKTILTESNDKFIEPLDPLYFLKGSNDLFIYRTSNRDGYRNLYLCDMDGKLTRITEVAADVAYVANDG